LALVGVWVPSLHFLYDYAWFVGFFTAGATYVAMMKFAAPVVPEEQWSVAGDR
jgi:NCS1 family nucleobase:cation symporter-1